VITQIKNISETKLDKKHKKVGEKKLARLMIGARIRVARIYCDLEQKELAQKVGVGQEKISRWESGISEPESIYVKKIAVITGFDWQFFYKD